MRESVLPTSLPPPPFPSNRGIPRHNDTETPAEKKEKLDEFWAEIEKEQEKIIREEAAAKEAEAEKEAKETEEGVVEEVAKEAPEEEKKAVKK